MAIQNSQMTIPVTIFKSRCLELLRRLEAGGEPIEITRHGRTVARLVPSSPKERDVRPWARLRGQGRLLARAEESVLTDGDFDALR